tara:strand:+ start:119 stop:301 length:183 start_codon:yes stop_codon:yes gene_type:complete
MHSRVFAQGSILAIALTTMGFREAMDRRGGRFPEPWDGKDTKGSTGMPINRGGKMVAGLK